MPKRRLWTERVIELFPIGDEQGRVSLTVRLVRSICFFSIFWLTGLVAITIDSMNLKMPFIDLLFWFLGNMIYPSISVVMAFVLSGWFRDKWNWFFDWSSHMLRLSEPEFRKLRDRLERTITSFIPGLVLALVFFIGYITPNLDALPESLMYLSTYWWSCTIFLVMLLLGTGIWLIISMWIGTFFTFREPLNIKLSRWTSRDFRPLAIWSLKCSLLYFVGAAMVIVVESIFGIFGDPFGALFVASIGFSVFFGVMAFLLPFYNIHRALVTLKKRELQKIEEESNNLMEELTETLAKHPTGDSKDYAMLIRLNVLQIRERLVTEADEWPIDMTVLSLLSAIVLTPILTQVIIEILYNVFTA